MTPTDDLKIDKDSSIAHLNDALNESSIQTVLSDLLIKESDQFSITGCKVIRFRVQPLQRAIVLYKIDILNSETQEKTKQWLTGMLYADPKKTRREFKK